jgi:hypothetical protein
MITLTGPLKMWSNDEGRMHFMTVPEEFVGEIKLHAMETPRGFGSVKVEATVDRSAGSGQAFTWHTSIFPSKSSGGYFLPVKIEVLRKTGIAAGDDVTVKLELL